MSYTVMKYKDDIQLKAANIFTKLWYIKITIQLHRQIQIWYLNYWKWSSLKNS